LIHGAWRHPVDALPGLLTAFTCLSILPPLMPSTLARASRLKVVATLLVAAWAWTGHEAWASPADPPATDPVLQLLQDRGFVSKESAAEGSLLVRQVRDVASDLVLAAMNFLGVPYKRGGSSADEGFDCSGFTRHIFEMSLGLVLPRRVDDQASASGLVRIRREELRPGDLVFFNTLRRTFSHVGIYLGDGKFIHAPRTGSEVRIEDMRQAYWDRRFTGARRAESTSPAAQGVQAVQALQSVQGATPGPEKAERRAQPPR
jgi:cell wall-associated NlpC family hydrolase